MRYENSGSDADSQNISQMVGWGWGSGNFTANLSYQKLKPIVARKTGYTTLDLSNLPGGYDGRRCHHPQMGGWTVWTDSRRFRYSRQISILRRNRENLSNSSDRSKIA